MPTVDEILHAKRQDLARRKSKTPIDAIRALASMQQRPAPFLNTVTEDEPVICIAQVQYSPDDQAADDPVAQAVRYARSGVDSIALFTDGTIYSGGMDDLMFVVQAVQSLQIPVITQDYIFDEYQVVEARAAGASGLVLDAGLLDLATLRGLISATQRNRMTALVRATSSEQVQRTIALSPQVIALGESLWEEMDVMCLQQLREGVPRHIRVAVTCGRLEQVAAARSLGADAVFLGEGLLAPALLPRVHHLLQ